MAPYVSLNLHLIRTACLKQLNVLTAAKYSQTDTVFVSQLHLGYQYGPIWRWTPRVDWDT